MSKKVEEIKQLIEELGGRELEELWGWIAKKVMVGGNLVNNSKEEK